MGNDTPEKASLYIGRGFLAIARDMIIINHLHMTYADQMY
jgi:hypothetical protein